MPTLFDSDKDFAIADARPSIFSGEVVDGVALAHLYGEPLFNLPNDLYIPPDALEVFLETFAGPLDLLLYLIRKQNFNILDIPMAQVTAQYLQYVEQIRVHNLELAGEYLLMAALLIEIKARMLLPVPPSIENEDSGDPRADLVKRLLVYEQVKLAAQQLALLPQNGYDFLASHAHHDHSTITVLPEVAAIDLWQVWQSLVQKIHLNSHHQVRRDPLSVRDYMARILRRLKPGVPVEFLNLFEEKFSIGELVVSFIAMLELVREHLIVIDQSGDYQAIYVRLSFTPQ